MTSRTADSFRTLGPGDAIREGLAVPFYLGDRRLRICVARAGGSLYAFGDLCTCTGGPGTGSPGAGGSCPLSGGLLTGTTIMCQCHGSEFDITTGAVLGGPAPQPLSVYEVQVI